jgi:large subunit ribosomal protein L24
MKTVKRNTKKFSTSWNSSKRPRKQRNYRKNAPLHIKQGFMGAHLSKELRQKHSIRTLPVVKGDKVKIMRGQFKKRENKIERIDLKAGKVYVTGVDFTKKDGSRAQYPFKPSNIMILELNMDDKKRKATLDRKAAKGTAPKTNTTKKEPKPAEATNRTAGATTGE